MKHLKTLYQLLSALLLTGLSSCTNLLNEANISPNVVDPAVSNPNMIMPNIMVPMANKYLDWGWGNISGTMQHIQHDGWYGGVNHYEWAPEDWNIYYDALRNNEFLLKSSGKFHQGIALTMKAFIFGNITDFWGDAPYTESLKGDKGLFEPQYDSQEVIYKGVIEDLKQAAAIFATGDNSGYLSGYDTFYGGDVVKWHKFANSLLLRYYLRVSEKLPDLAKAGVEAVYNSGVYLTSSPEDATISFVGSSASNMWPYIFKLDQVGQSNFRRIKPAQTLLSQLMKTQDPRLQVWFAPVHVQWVADKSLPKPVDDYIRKDGVPTNMAYADDVTLKALITDGHKLTKRFNPDTYTGAPLDTNLFVGVPAGMRWPDTYNGNPTPGQTVENQHVSQLSDLYRYSNDNRFLKGKLISASEVAFILAEAALKGYQTGNAKTHYENGIRLSLQAWGVEEQYDRFIGRPEVAYQGNLEQLITQKWISSWTMSAEAWMDFRRTGLPRLEAGAGSAQPVLPVRFIYGDKELSLNRHNANEAIKKLEKTQYAIQPNNQWSKPWVIQGTGKPW
ncbi:hypothetical protein GCM10023091_02890 [Ravibacter arvi]|uniref:SusD-like starch-binding protein associating with outer membrane n=1 Tax=Ravibacter arvi TaxID=2051041 RepID=A0ABP8LNF3_9BACT